MSFLLPIRFCTQCGQETVLQKPIGDERERALCKECGFVHYQNPRIVTCVLATDSSGKILMAKRNIEPKKNLWTLPGGFMELYETVEESARRECEEETYCRVILQQLISVVSVADIGQVHLFFRAEITHFDPRPTAESQEVALFAPEDLPWAEMAFTTVRTALRHYLTDPFGLQVASLGKERGLSVFQ